jgi:hypothetical protein
MRTVYLLCETMIIAKAELRTQNGALPARHFFAVLRLSESRLATSLHVRNFRRAGGPPRQVWFLRTTAERSSNHVAARLLAAPLTKFPMNTEHQMGNFVEKYAGNTGSVKNEASCVAAAA